MHGQAVRDNPAVLLLTIHFSLFVNSINVSLEDFALGSRISRLIAFKLISKMTQKGFIIIHNEIYFLAQRILCLSKLIKVVQNWKEWLKTIKNYQKLYKIVQTMSSWL